MKAFYLYIILFASLCQEDYTAYFKKGMEEVKNGNEKQAIPYFLNSYNLKNKAKTSYYIAACYFNIGEYMNAKVYALKAKNADDSSAVILYKNQIDLILNFSVPINSPTVVITQRKGGFASGTLHEKQDLSQPKNLTPQQNASNDLPRNNFSKKEIQDILQKKTNPNLLEGRKPSKILIEQDSI